MHKDVRITQADNGFVISVITIQELPKLTNRSAYQTPPLPQPVQPELYIANNIEELIETIKKIYEHDSK